MYVSPADGLFVGRPDHMYVRRQFQQRRYGNIVIGPEPVLISQRRSDLNRTRDQNFQLRYAAKKAVP